MRGVAHAIARSRSLKAKVLLRRCPLSAGGLLLTSCSQSIPRTIEKRTGIPPRITSSTVKLDKALLRSSLMLRCRTISRTLNTPYHRHYDGLGEAMTTYPISAFVTHMLYLKGTLVPVDVKAVTVCTLLFLLLPGAHCFHLGSRCEVHRSRWDGRHQDTSAEVFF